MPKLKNLGAADIISALTVFGFEQTSQRGSHIKLVRQTSIQKQVLIIPNHNQLSKGTIKAILDQASRFVPQEELQKYFYTE